MVTMTIKTSEMAVMIVKSMETTILVETVAKEGKWGRGFNNRQYSLQAIGFQKQRKYILGSTMTNFIAYMA